jgi:hypothetical protein
MCLASLAVLAGCIGGPFGGQDGPVTVDVNNSANVTYTFEVSVVEYPSTVTTHFDDGRTGRVEIGPGGSTHSSGDNQTWTEVELPESARLHGRYTLEPGEQVRTSIEEFSTDSALVIVISRSEHEIVELVSNYCGGDLNRIEVTMHNHGSTTIFNCQGSWF